MKEKLQQRLQSLKTEYEVGQKMLADLEARQAKLRDTLLRINGAIQMLEEILNESLEAPDPEDDAVAAEAASAEQASVAE